MRAAAWSPSESKILIAQSDNITFLYSLGSKKAIVGKFATSSPVSFACWPHLRPSEAILACDDGKVTLLNLNTNKSAKLHEHPSAFPAAAAASSPDGNSCAIAFSDGSMHRFTLRESQQPIHACLPTLPACAVSIAWTGANCLVGVCADNTVVAYSLPASSAIGATSRKLDLSITLGASSPSSAASSPSGEQVAVACGPSLAVISVPKDGSALVKAGQVNFPASQCITHLAWNTHGSQLALGTLKGSVHTVSTFVTSSVTHSGRFQIVRVSRSAAIVRDLQGPDVDSRQAWQLSVQSKEGETLDSIKVRNQQYIIAHTARTLIIGDLHQGLVSEIPWEPVMTKDRERDKRERFSFAHEGACIAYKSGEAYVIRLGHDEPVTTLQMSHWGSRLMSVQLESAFRGESRHAGRIAYLVDPETLAIETLWPADHARNADSTVINHGSAIDFLELNSNATHVLFRNKRKQLHLLDVESQERRALLAYCTYAQWVPGADVVVAHDGDRLLVWYSVIDTGSCKELKCPTGAQPLSIERKGGRTYILVDNAEDEEGQSSVRQEIDLEEALVELGNAIDGGNLEHAAATLEPLEVTPEEEPLWRKLGSRALKEHNFELCARCYAALGDVSKARFMMQLSSKAASGQDGAEVNVSAELSLLEKQIDKAEAMLLDARQVDSAIDMRKRMHDMDGAVRVAEAASHPSIAELRRERHDSFIRSGQEEKAADVKVEEGDCEEACALLLRGGLPGKAAALVSQHRKKLSEETIEAVSAALFKYGMIERAGKLFEDIGNYAEAKENYRSAGAYPKALTLARYKNPADVVPLEFEYADWLASCGQSSAAATHYVEAGQREKAARTALEARNLTVAECILDQQSADFVQPLLTKAAQLAEQAGDCEHAERLHLKAGNTREAVEVLARGGLWEQAHRCASAHLSDGEASQLYKRRAEELEANLDLKAAEKAYLAANEPSLAIDMRWRHHDIDGAIRIVGAYKKDKLPQARQEAAEKLEAEGRLSEAERYHLAGQSGWQACVQMYRSAGQWEDAMRIAKSYGGQDASNQVAFAWASTMSGSAAAQLLRWLGLLREGIDNATERRAFEHALDIALSTSETQDKIQEVRLKRAMHLEDVGFFKEAEEEFIKASHPKEAIDMYVHQRDFTLAMRVAQQHEPGALQEVQIADARSCIERRDLGQAEARFIDAQRPELAVDMYKKARRWEDAMRVAEDYAPSRVSEIHRQLQAGEGSSEDMQET